jgi:hypothetical protein
MIWRLKIKRKMPISIPIRKAVLCEDCREITASLHSTCPVCGSRALWPLAAILEKQEQELDLDQLLSVSQT